ncbi:MAG: TauD/TfdA family dioxygenase [Sphingomonadaceae bacterium]
MTIDYADLKPAFGARVRATPEQLTDPAFARECLDLLNRRDVLVFPEIDLTDAQQLAFTDLLGIRSDFARRDPGVEGEESEIYRVTLDSAVKDETQYVLATYFWHMDGVTVVADPPRATLLSARQMSAEGGETEFASTRAAYAALPEDAKAKLDGMRAMHSVYAGVRPLLEFGIGPEEWGGVPIKTEQPLVHTAEDGTRSLILGVQAESIVGMELPEARAFLTRLMEWATQPDFRYRHKWAVGDLVMWKNLSAMHRVIPYAADSGRMMHRTSIAKFRELA